MSITDRFLALSSNMNPSSLAGASDTTTNTTTVGGGNGDYTPAMDLGMDARRALVRQIHGDDLTEREMRILLQGGWGEVETLAPAYVNPLVEGTYGSYHPSHEGCILTSTGRAIQVRKATRAWMEKRKAMLA